MRTRDKLKLLYQLGFEKEQPKIFSFHDCLPDVFSQYIELLIYKRYRILGADELIERLSDPLGYKKNLLRANPGIRMPKEAVLTFDDGRRNCWSVIFPLLKKYKVKAVFFIITSRIKDTDKYYPNLEDYWDGRVSWESLYSSHREEPYLTWKELEIMQESGLVEIASHGLLHNIISVSNRVVDFQHPGVYEMPVYFDEWIEAGRPELDTFWGTPIFESAWAPLVSNEYLADKSSAETMNDFVKRNGGFLFFKKKAWRKKLFDYYYGKIDSFGPGGFNKLKDRKEDARLTIIDSKKMIEDKIGSACRFFSLPLYQGCSQMMPFLKEAGYEGVFTGYIEKEGCSLDEERRLSFVNDRASKGKKCLFIARRIPSFWIKFLTFF